MISFCVLIEEFLCEKISEEYSGSFLCYNDPTYARVASIRFLSLITPYVICQFTSLRQKPK